MKQREPKPKRYLVAVGCTEPADPRRRRPGSTPDVLTHTRYEVVTTRDPAHAQARADVLAREFRCIAYGNGECTPVAVLSVAPEKYKKMAARVPRIVVTDETEEKKAQQYARWLAARDGIKIPTCGTIRLDWSGVYSKTRKTGRGHAIYERRIRAVQWGHKEPVYNTRKDGRRGAWAYDKWVVDFEIGLPNWDWQPDEPVEEIVGDMAIAA